MADTTPAWSEAYAAVLQGIIVRFTSGWGAVDFLNQIGDDPARATYPASWKGVIVPHKDFREYNAPGWTGNGLARFPDGSAAGVQADPIAAEGMLFYKGWLLLVMSLYTYVSGDDLYITTPWPCANLGGKERLWTMDQLAEQLATQWGQRACGLH